MEQSTDLLQWSALEIKQLRAENKLMASRLDVFDKMILLLHTAPNYQLQGMSEDIVWKIEKYLAANEKTPQ